MIKVLLHSVFVGACFFQITSVVAEIRVNCVGCDQYEFQVTPYSGIWVDPLQPGTGIRLQIQQGVVRGQVLTYTEEGASTWLSFDAVLVDARPDALWRLEGTLMAHEGGSCPTCQYAESTTTPAGEITIEFEQRNLARASVAGGSPQRLIPLIWGVPTMDYFPEHSDYLLPALEGKWNLVYNIPELLAYGLFSEIVSVLPASEYIYQGRHTVKHPIEVQVEGSPEEIGSIRCHRDPLPDDTLGPPDCRLVIAFNSPDGYGSKVFKTAIANIGDARIQAQAPNGWEVELFRLGYD